jgi:cell growth-regulating nucleolar protein
MVWFQCEDCGENLKKPKLAGHFRSCSAYKVSGARPFHTRPLSGSLVVPLLTSDFFVGCFVWRLQLSCIDCGEFFSQDTVQGHTQCISEAVSSSVSSPHTLQNLQFLCAIPMKWCVSPHFLVSPCIIA